MLTKEAILSAEDRKTETVGVPEWGGDVRVVSMTGAERSGFNAALTKRAQNGSIDTRLAKAVLVAHALFGDDGKRMFGDDEIDALNGKDAAVLDRLNGVAERLNGIGEAAVKEAEGN